MIVPAEAGRVPARMASSVDFPAPFGPIRPVSVPFRTDRDTLSTARTPPKSRTRPTASSTTSLAPALAGAAGLPGLAELAVLGMLTAPGRSLTDAEAGAGAGS